MNELLAQFRSAVVSTLLFVLLCCGVYPLLVYVVARAAFPAQAGGSLVTENPEYSLFGVAFSPVIAILAMLGVGVGQADVWVSGIRCDGAVLVN